MKKLYVLYDARCGLCTWARQWMLRKPVFLMVDFIPAGSVTSKSRFPGLESEGTPEELIVVDDQGGVYRGSDAWVMCLYALREYRGWSLRLARPALLPLARSAFQLLSKNRLALSRFLDLRADEPLKRRLELAPTPACNVGGRL